MLVHTFDTSALSDLAEHSEFGLARHRLLAEIDAGRIVVLGTAPLVWELPGLHAKDPALFRACIDLLLRITKGRVLFDPIARREAELRAEGPLTYPACVDPEHRIVWMDDAKVIAEAAATNGAMVRGLRTEESQAAKDAAAALDAEARRQAEAKGEAFDPKAWRRALAKAGKDLWYGQADFNAHRNVLRMGARAGIHVSKVDHRRVPSFWSSAVIHSARIRAVLVEGTSPAGRKSVGQLDLLHLEEAAAYADVFVTSDRRLRAFAGSVKKRLELRCEVLSPEAFAKRLTG